MAIMDSVHKIARVQSVLIAKLRHACANFYPQNWVATVGHNVSISAILVSLPCCRLFRPNLRKQIIIYKIIESGLYNPTYYKLRLLFTNYLLYLYSLCVL